MLYYLILLSIAILPVVVLMSYIYRQDKYQKEPIKSLAKAFLGGILSIGVDIVIVSGIDSLFGDSGFTETIFYQSFLQAGIPEEFSKFVIFMLFIWRDKNFDEYFDGIVYATFIGLGFACLENIEYVFEYGFGTGVVRALISVPGHFLFGVVLGYFLSMAKFRSGKRNTYIIMGLLSAMLAHGLFDWLLMITEVLSPAVSSIIYIVFIWGDIKLWKLGLKYISKQQENSRLQAEANALADDDTDESTLTANPGYNSEYKRINWNAGDKR